MASSDYKKFDREVKGYVEVLYNLKTPTDNDIISCYYYDVNNTKTLLTKFEYGQSFYEILKTPRVIGDYAILFDDYTKLDGSCLLFNKLKNDCGFVSLKTPAEIETYDERNIIFEIKLSEAISGLTFYFKENTIKNAKIYLYIQDSDTPEEMEIVNNIDETIFIDLSEKKCSHIIIETYQWSNPNKKIWIKRLDLGLSHVYQGNELVEFTVTEQVNKLVEETPSNELSLTVGDYDNLYDPLNPKGIMKYLSEKSTFIPYIGIVNEGGYTEYTKMGEFFFKNIDFQNKEVILKAYNLMDSLNKMLITNIDGSLSTETGIIAINELSNYLQKYLNNNFNGNYVIDINNKIRMYLKALKRVSLAEFLQQASMIDGIFYIDRDNNIVIKNIDKNIKETLSKNELIEELKYTNEQIMKSFNLQRNVYTLTSTKETNDTNNFSTTFILENSSQVVCITSDDASVLSWLKDDHLTVNGATNFHIIKSGTSNDFTYMLFIYIEGEVGTEIIISGKYPNKKDKTTSTETNIIGIGEPSLTIENPFYLMQYYLYDDMFTNFFDKFYTYSGSFEYNGNPMIKAGEYIEVESNYGYISLFVTKHTLKFNGGLSGSIEGVE